MQGYLEKDAKKIGARIILYHIDWFSLICGEFYAIMNSGGDNMRQADSTIRGYLYQFNKSIYSAVSLNNLFSIVAAATPEYDPQQTVSGCCHTALQSGTHYCYQGI